MLRFRVVGGAQVVVREDVSSLVGWSMEPSVTLQSWAVHQVRVMDMKLKPLAVGMLRATAVSERLNPEPPNNLHSNMH